MKTPDKLAERGNQILGMLETIQAVAAQDNAVDLAILHCRVSLHLTCRETAKLPLMPGRMSINYRCHKLARKYPSLRQALTRDLSRSFFEARRDQKRRAHVRVLKIRAYWGRLRRLAHQYAHRKGTLEQFCREYRLPPSTLYLRLKRYRTVLKAGGCRALLDGSLRSRKGEFDAG